jgi:hypothetical protein
MTSNVTSSRSAWRTLIMGSALALGLIACGDSPAPIGDTQQPFAADQRDDPATAEGSSDACATGTAPEDTAQGECQITARALCFSSVDAACACAGCGTDECAIAESFPPQAVCPGSPGPDPDRPTSDDPNTPVDSPNQGGGSNGYPGSGPLPGGGSDGSPGCGQPGHPGPSPSACDAGVPQDPTGVEPCDFIVGDACFDSAAGACACAGCADDRCAVLESYPAQILCQ